ncbi:SusC/RagA family TonB-linked outer membrane protein [Parabacteroides pacaensis]|uniref:SusC/RagA family TonB-linked outer membrane protein n=1 Tax=Parabacteroides pacaensis TaxID=2086575 RepID=UPI000D0E7809|nr:TonB-dependent receptor [Parabacteroides pacaensis]
MMETFKNRNRLLSGYLLTGLFCLLCIQSSGANPKNKAIGKARETSFVNQQKATKTIQGTVTDDMGEVLPGANILIKGSTKGVTADMDGTFSIDVKETDILVISFLGMETKEVPVKGKTTLSVVLKPKIDELDEVTVVAFAKQKKESVISSISTVKPAELKIPSSNMTTALGGRIAGIISYQRSGEPGRDNAEFFVRGVTTFGYKANPLILIDNVELTSSDLARLQPDDIASFSIMKDASATALYGARGANGVILVTTKEGREGKAQLNIRFENSFSAPTKKVEVVDPVTYMKLHNEAVLTRNPQSPRPYSDAKIAATANGENPYMYPAVNWYDELFKNYTSNQRLNLNLSGGGKVARYYIAGTFNNDNGVLKMDKKNNFNNNINLKRIQLRSNTNITVTPTTDVSVKFSGTFEDYTGPIDSGDNLYKKVMAANPVLFPKFYLPNDEFANTQHILFGNYGTGNYINPYADMVKGYKDYSTMVLVAQIEFKQKLDFITPGLGARLLGSTTRDSYFDVTRNYNPFYYSLSFYDKETGRYGLTNLNPNDGTEYLQYNEGGKTINTAFYMEGAIDYNRTFNETHAVSGLLVYTMREHRTANAGDLQKSLAARNLGLSGRFTYAYDSRYFAEFNFGYNGSERFSSKERFGFYPSAGLGWILSNENFWPEQKVVHKLKLKGTYGLVGNDAIGDENDRFFYLSNVNLNNTDKQNISFGKDFTYRPGGISISRYANDQITWETSRKLNLGLELGLFKDIELQVDYFTEKRTNILMTRAAIPSTMGLQADLRANVGEASSHGFELSLDINHSFNKDFWISSRTNFTYAKSKYDVYEEPDYGYPWLSWVGLPIRQQTGLIAERLFIDDADIANSPKQTYGTVMPGDIKYKDINDDGIINGEDIVPIGYPDTPNIMYGFGASVGYKGFDFSFFCQGSAQSSFFIDLQATSPFIKNTDGILGGKDNNNAMLKVWADDFWSESNRNSYAKWPRLSAEKVDNNMQRSTWFLHDGSYLRLKSVELGYTFPLQLTKKIGLNSFRLYFSGLNLLTFSKFKMWDPEMGGNGLGYPIQRVYNVGLNVNF